VRQPFDFGGSAVAAIAPASPDSAAGVLRVYGWGYSNATSLDGHLRSLDQTIVRAYRCGGGTPAMLCGEAPTGATCFGDSGGGLITPDRRLAGVESIIVDDNDGDADCDAGENTGYVDIAAPAIALWLAGTAAPPRAPRTTGRTGLQAGDPLTCESPAWTESPQLSYDFLLAGTGELLQSGPATYHPTGANVGRAVTCVAVARNAGGTAEALASTPVTMYDPGLALHVNAAGAVAVTRVSPNAPVSRLVIYDSAGAVVSAHALDLAKPMTVPKLPAGRYSVCVQSDPTTTFVAGSACQAWIVAGKAGALLSAASTQRRHGRWRVALRAAPALVGKRVTLRWTIARCRTCKARQVSVRRKLAATTRVNSPSVPRARVVRLVATLPAASADGVPYAAGRKVFKIRDRRG
jgi:hypothetical protein